MQQEGIEPQLFINNAKYNNLKKIVKENGDLNYYKATLNENSKILKVRIYPYQQLLPQEIEFIKQIQQQYNEFEQSPNKQENQCYFVKIYEYFEEEGQQYLVFENQGKDLQTEIRNNIQYYQDKYKLQICKDITRAVEFLHKKQTIARTLKPQDFVRIGQTYKLINFSYIRDSIQYGRNKTQKPNEYSAPEFVYKQQKNFYELDIWSLGMIFYEIFSGNPLIEQQTLYDRNEIQQQEYIQNTLSKSSIQFEIKQLLLKMLNFDRKQRPKIDEILKSLEKQNNIMQEPNEILKLEKIIDNTNSNIYKTQISNNFINQEIQIKFLSPNNQVENEFLNQLFQDCDLYPYMIKIHKKFNWNDQQIVVTELGQQDLLSYLNQNTNLSFENRKEICQNITQQIHYLHYKDYVYGELRMENIYRINSTFKIIGFEKIRYLNKQELEQISFIESNLYTSPELLEDKNIIHKGSDIWSLGCIWYEIFSGQILFDGQNILEVEEKIKNHKKDQDPVYKKIDSLNIVKELIEQIKLMLHPDYQQRIVIENILKVFPAQPNQFPFNNKLCQVEKIFQNAKQIQPIYKQLSADRLIQSIKFNIQLTIGNNESIEKIRNWNKIQQKLCQHVQEFTKELIKQIEEKNKNLLYFQYPKSIFAFNQFPKMLNFCQQGFIQNNI